MNSYHKDCFIVGTIYNPVIALDYLPVSAGIILGNIAS